MPATTDRTETTDVTGPHHPAAPPDRREALLPKHREVLEQLERKAREEGRDGEADLFKMAREAS